MFLKFASSKLTACMKSTRSMYLFIPLNSKVLANTYNILIVRVEAFSSEDDVEIS